MILNLISGFLLLFIILCGIYLWAIAIASIKALSKVNGTNKLFRFAIAIPAHNEANVIGNTVATLKKLNYPLDMFDIFVVADFCTDQTAQISRDTGAICFERINGKRGGKGSALGFLFEHIFSTRNDYDAVVVFDADTLVDKEFLQVMNVRLNQNAQVIQGKHVINNPHMGWIPSLSWALMTIDNRYSNQGRVNLKLSAKHMGDSICFRTDVLKRFGWGQGLTEDYEFRLKLLLEGICIQYEPNAIGNGQATLTLKDAQAQRLRWIKGVTDARRLYSRYLISEGVQRRDWCMIDGVLSSLVPSYSILTLTSIAIFFISLLIPTFMWSTLTYIWGGITILWLIYPFMGLILERSPGWAYLAILTGPFYILWRTWLYIYSKLAPNRIHWIRTPHHEDIQKQNSKRKIIH